MNKQELDQLIEQVQFDCFYQTVEACQKEWGIDFKGKDVGLNYPPRPPLPDTQDEVVKAIQKTRK